MGEWVMDPEANLMSPANLHRVEQVLARPMAGLFGWHYWYAGGSSRSSVTYTDFRSYLDEVEASRAGDHFTLYDFDASSSLAMATVRVGSGAVPDLRSLPQLTTLLAEPHAEVAIVARSPVGEMPAVHLVELNEPDDETWREVQELCAASAVTLVIDEAVLDLDEDGCVVATPSPAGKRRLHAVVDAKRPSAEGLVPTSGPY